MAENRACYFCGEADCTGHRCHSDGKPHHWTGRRRHPLGVAETRAEYLQRVRGDCRATDYHGDYACCECHKSHSAESCCTHGTVD